MDVQGGIHTSVFRRQILTQTSTMVIVIATSVWVFRPNAYPNSTRGRAALRGWMCLFSIYINVYIFSIPRFARLPVKRTSSIEVTHSDGLLDRFFDLRSGRVSIRISTHLQPCTFSPACAPFFLLQMGSSSIFGKDAERLDRFGEYFCWAGVRPSKSVDHVRIYRHSMGLRALVPRRFLFV